MGWADNEADQRERARGGRYQRGERRGGKVIAEYDYYDEKGEPYHRVERTEGVDRSEGKQFPQSHWVPGIDGVKLGRWVPGEPRGPKIPYFLPDLVAASPETTVFICEGEKDAETVCNFDLVSTTNPGGAGKWQPELNKWFVGKKLAVLLEDNDKAGRRHVLKVARNLFGIVEEVRIVRFDKLPDGKPMPEGGDVSDWVAAGGTKEMLLAMAEAAKPFRGFREIQFETGKIAQAQDELEYALIEAEQPVLIRARVW